MAALVREIERAARASGEQVFASAHMGARDVHDMDVVADAGAVRRIVVGAENLNRRAAPSGFEDERDQVGLGIVRLAYLAVRVGTRRVEVAQRHLRQSVRRAEVHQHVLDDELGEAAGVDRLLRVVFADRHLFGHAVDRGGR